MNSKWVFAIRLILFIIFSALVPFVYIAVRFGIFKKSENSFSGWGIIALVIVVVVTIYIVNKVLSGLPVTMFTQCVKGIMTVIVPLVCAILLLQAISRAINLFTEVLIVTTVSEMVAIPLNPLPKWLEKVKQKKESEGEK